MTHEKQDKKGLIDRRWFRFLLGLVVSLATFYAALEYTTEYDPLLEEADEIEASLSAIEMMPAIQQEDMMRVARTEKAKKPSRIVVVEQLSDNQQEEEGAPQPLGTTDPEPEETHEQVDTPPAEPAGKDQPMPLRTVEKIPEFPGGMSLFVRWLNEKLSYPPMAQRQKIEGQVVVSFIVNKDGSISDAKIARSVHPLLDREAMRVVRMMPRWTPGVDNGQPCRTLLAIPIVFKL